MQHMLSKKMYTSLKIDARKGEKKEPHGKYNREAAELLIHSNSLRPLPLIDGIFRVCGEWIRIYIYIYRYTSTGDDCNNIPQ
jgi:hypothetical protein